MYGHGTKAVILYIIYVKGYGRSALLIQYFYGKELVLSPIVGSEQPGSYPRPQSYCFFSEDALLLVPQGAIIQVSVSLQVLIALLPPELSKCCLCTCWVLGTVLDSGGNGEVRSGVPSSAESGHLCLPFSQQALTEPWLCMEHTTIFFYIVTH